MCIMCFFKIKLEDIYQSFSLDPPSGGNNALLQYKKAYDSCLFKGKQVTINLCYIALFILIPVEGKAIVLVKVHSPLAKYIYW